MSRIKKKSSADRKLGIAAAMTAQTEVSGMWETDSSSADENERAGHQFSEGFLASMEDIFREEERQIKKEKRAAIMRVAAVFALVVFCGGAVAGGHVEAWRERFYNRFFREKLRYTESVTSGESAQIEAFREKYPRLYLPDMLPDEMKLEVRLYNEEAERYSWRAENEEHYISVMQTKTAKGVLNTEDNNLKRREYNGITYYWVQNENASMITWAADGYQFTITSSYRIRKLSVVAETFRRKITKN